MRHFVLAGSGQLHDLHTKLALEHPEVSQTDGAITITITITITTTNTVWACFWHSRTRNRAAQAFVQLDDGRVENSELG
jgi:hypothetical protein